MICRQAERWLLASFDRDLPSSTGRTVSEHLERCPECPEKGRGIRSLAKPDRRRPGT